MDIAKVRVAYGSPYSMKNAISAVSSLLPLIKLKSDHKIQSISNLLADVVTDPPNRSDEVILLSAPILRKLCADFSSKLKTLLENNVLLLIDDQDCHQQWQELIEDYPWLSEAESLYRITDIPSEEDEKTLYIQTDFLTKLLDVNGMHLIDRNNDTDGFFCLMHTRRPHRDLLIKKLYEGDFIGGNNLITYHNISNEISPPDRIKPFQDLIGFNQKQKPFDDLVGFNESAGGWPDGQISPPYNKYALELIVETSVKVIFHTEKTSRPLLAGMPFMILGAPGYLAYLRSIGFKTFNQYWDESYDLEPDLDKRIDMILNNLKMLTANPGMMLDIYKKARDITEHNRDNILAIKGRAPYRDANKLKNFIEGIERNG